MLSTPVSKIANRTPAPSALGDYRPIEAEGRVRFLADACLALRSGPDACAECVTACPVACIQPTDSGYAVSSGCINCGVCAAACPSGALAVKGFESLTPSPSGNVIRIECRKVPESIAGQASLRVPCLAGMTPSQWLSIAEMAGNRRVIVVDRSWCAHCVAGSRSAPQHPARHALDRADAVLAEIGWSPVQRPRIQHDPLPASLMPASIPAERPASPARRAFFRRLGNEAQRAVGLDNPAEIPLPRLMKQQGLCLPERDRLLTTARRLAIAAGGNMPAAPFAALAIAADCGHHGICAGLCPTGALALYEDGNSAGLEFNAWRCIGCGHCVQSCPERAISLHAAPRAPDPQVPERLTAHRAKPCLACREAFHGPADATTCPSCQRKRQMGTALFGTMLAVKKS